MSRWRLRIVGIAVIAALAGVPAASTWCDALCVALGEAASHREGAAVEHQSGSDPSHTSGAHEAVPAQPIATHPHHPDVASRTARARVSQPAAARIVGPGCCSTPSTARMISLGADRADGSLMAAPVAVSDTIPPEPPASASARIGDAAPPVARSVGRLIALRI